MALIQTITYPLPPGLNEIISAARRSPYTSAALKKKWTNIIANSSLDLIPYEDKVWVNFEWVLKNQKKDFDNVTAGMKFIFDGLVKAGVLKNDSQKYIGNRIIHDYLIDKDSGDCCRVTLSDIIS